MHRAMMAVLLVGFAATGARAQDELPEWRLGEPLLRTGDAIELHRVGPATELPDGSIAIADAGNRRIVVVSPTGDLVRTYGRMGSGPGEFRSLTGLASFGDTLVAYDPFLNRLSLFSGAGSLIRTSALPSFDKRTLTVVDFESVDRYLAVTRTSRMGTSGGLAIDSAAVLHVTRSDVSAAETVVPFAYSYHVIEGVGTTTYPVRFLGETMLFAAAGKTVISPLGGAHVLVMTPSRRSRSIELRVDRTARDRALVDAHLDSIVRSAEKEGWVGSRSFKRLTTVFGPTFPVPGERSLFSAGRALGAQVWLRAFPIGEGTTADWYIFDARAERFVGHIELPRTTMVIGGSGEHVIIMTLDEFDVQHVSVHGLAQH